MRRLNACVEATSGRDGASGVSSYPRAPTLPRVAVTITTCKAHMNYFQDNIEDKSAAALSVWEAQRIVPEAHSPALFGGSNADIL